MLGGWTTFSALAVDAVQLGSAGQEQVVLVYLTATFLVGTLAVAAGSASRTTGLARAMTLTTALLVALGAAVGAPLRYLVNHGIRARFGGTPTAGTLVVNVVGLVRARPASSAPASAARRWPWSASGSAAP